MVLVLVIVLVLIMIVDANIDPSNVTYDPTFTVITDTSKNDNQPP